MNGIIFMTEYLDSPNPTESFPEENFEVFSDITPEQFKSIVLMYADSKIVRVSPELIEELGKYNDKSIRQKAREKFAVRLADFKKKEVYKNLSNEEICTIESQKIIDELEKYAKHINNIVLIQSTKEKRRIL